jgi:hypothetical protein
MLWQPLRDTAFIVGGFVGSGQPTAKPRPWVCHGNGLASRLALGPIAIAPGGRGGHLVSDNLLTPIDLATGRAGASAPSVRPRAVWLTRRGFPRRSPSLPTVGRHIHRGAGYGTIVPVRLSPLAAGNSIFLEGHPSTTAIAPNGGRAYVTNPSTGVIDLVNVASCGGAAPHGRYRPQEIAIAPNGQQAHVSAGNKVVSSVVPIDLATRSVLPPSRLAHRAFVTCPAPFAVSPDGRAVDVAIEEGFRGAPASMLSTASNKVIARFGRFSGPAGIALVSGIYTLYVLSVASSGDGEITLGGPKRAIDGNALVPHRSRQWPRQDTDTDTGFSSCVPSRSILISPPGPD